VAGLVGGLALIAPIWFAGDRAERLVVEGPSADGADPALSQPGLRAVLAAQQRSAGDALSTLDDERSNVTDLYFVGFAGDAREDVFRKDVQAAQKRDGRALGHRRPLASLINNPRTLLESPRRR
jgi:hypothetical protein